MHLCVLSGPTRLKEQLREACISYNGVTVRSFVMWAVVGPTSLKYEAECR